IRALPSKSEINIEDASDRFFKLEGNDLMDRLAMPAFAPSTHSIDAGKSLSISAGDAYGGAAGIGALFSGMRSAARNLLNYVTYYEMKSRAGVIGSLGVNQLIRRIQSGASAVKVHVIGHSFGGRLVTAALMGRDGQAPIRVNTMTLLQAAFSHNGFS